jgi:4-hydroxyproline epimerase
LAHLHAKGLLAAGEASVHESYIFSTFVGKVAATTTVGGAPAVIATITGSAMMTGSSTIWLDDEDPFWSGFQVI